VQGLDQIILIVHPIGVSRPLMMGDDQRKFLSGFCRVSPIIVNHVGEHPNLVFGV
jgi:hypothetical protein